MENLKNALESGEVNIAEVVEELNYRDASGGNRWNDFLYEYTTEELQEIESHALDYVDAASAERVFTAIQEMERRLGGKTRRTLEDIRACFVDAHIIQVFTDEKQMFEERGECAPDFEAFLLDFIEQNIQSEAAKP